MPPPYHDFLDGFPHHGNHSADPKSHELPPAPSLIPPCSASDQTHWTGPGRPPAPGETLADHDPVG
ncbi:MAG: hypothetical protein RJB39_689 [Candidatus Parcubacteria bacterium]